jgi:hypothetical protein
MPRGDRTGPLGEGPMTGRQLGYGAGFDSPGYTKGAGERLGRGFRGRGAGFGRGYGRGFFRQGFDPGYFWRGQEPAQPADIHGETDIDTLKSEIRDLKDRLSTIMKHMESFTSVKDEK